MDIKKLAVITTFLLPSSYAIAMEPQEPNNNGRAEKYDAEKALLATELSQPLSSTQGRDNWLPAEVIDKINRTGAELDHFGFTCPRAEELNAASTLIAVNGKRFLDINQLNKNRKIPFVNLTGGLSKQPPPFKFVGVLVHEYWVECVYDSTHPIILSSTRHTMTKLRAESSRAKGGSIDGEKCHVTDEKFHDKEELLAKATGEYFSPEYHSKSYMSDNPDDIKIICDK